MQLSDVLSKQPSLVFKTVDGFLIGKAGKIGQKVQLKVSPVLLNYYCESCENMRTFSSKGELACIFVNRNMISIDCVMACACGSTVEAWFIVESENDITSANPKIRILKRSERLSDTVRINTSRYGEYDYLLDKAQRAYREELGAGAIVYLRKIYESITIQMAQSVDIEIINKDGYQRPFKKILTEVDKRCHILPREYSGDDGYKLFGELSDIVHGEYDEELGLKKFETLYKLVTGILDNVRNKEEFNEAKRALGWPEDEGEPE